MRGILAPSAWVEIMLSVFDYTDYRRFLKDWLDGREGRPSLRTLAKKAGCSPATLSFVTNAARDLSDRQAVAIATALALETEERDYFLDLVEIEQADTRPRRQEALGRVMSKRRFRASREIVDALYAIFDRWYYAAILELVRCEGFVEDPAWIAATLRPAVTAAEAEAALRTLGELGLLVRGDDGRLRPADVALRTNHEVERVVGQVVGRNQQWMLRRAADALEEFQTEERHYATATLAVSDGMFTAAKRLATGLHEDVLALPGSDAGPLTRIVQVSVQIVPLSARTVVGPEATG